LLIIYYKDLKNSIKDKLSRINKSNNLSKIIIKIYKINNYFYLKNQKKKGRYKTYRKTDIVKNPKNSDWLNPIKLDITTKYLIL